jgi:hypothetical protein
MMPTRIVCFDSVIRAGVAAFVTLLLLLQMSSGNDAASLPPSSPQASRQIHRP